MDSIADPAAKPTPPKSPWNSLEVAKLIVSIIVCVVGALLVHTLTQERDAKAEQEKKDAARAADVRLQAAAVEAKIRRNEDAAAAALAAEKIRADARDQIKFNGQLAFDRERALQAEAFARDAAIRSQANSREDAIRAELSKSARDSKLIDRRVEIWSEIGPKINDIYAYIARVGRWKELRAADVIQIKREIDRTAFTYRAFFSDEWQAAYEDFMNAAFDSYRGDGVNAGIRTSMSGRPLDTDATAFSTPMEDEFKRAHHALQAQTADQVGAINIASSAGFRGEK